MNQENDYLIVGEIVGSFGIKGEVKLHPETEFPERFKPGASVWVGADKTEYTIEGARTHSPHILLKLKGVNDRDAAERFRRSIVYIPISQAVPLEEGAFYHYQLIGLRVFTDKGQDLGTVAEILITGSNDVFVVKGKMGEVLIPVTKEVIQSISPEEGRIVIVPIEGLIGPHHEDDRY